MTTEELVIGDMFRMDTLERGRPAQINCVVIDGQTFALRGGAIRTLALEDEWYEDVKDPHAVIAALTRANVPKADLLTFWQRPPDFEPRFAFHTEFEALAVLPIRSYDHWMTHQIKSRIRSLIRKSAKDGLILKEVPFDNAFVRGMTAIFNEAQVRQGRRFWHYGKDFDTIKSQFSRHLYRERMIGAYYQGEMIGFIMLSNMGRFATPGQIISSIKHRDKATSNALIAKAVEVCAVSNIEYLVYYYWGDDSLTEFKRRCGFECMLVPRYYVPLTQKGRLALRINAHRGIRGMLPESAVRTMRNARNKWNGMQRML